LKCEDLFKTLNDYVDGEFEPAVCEQFEGHLADCNPCQVVDNIRQTIRLYRAREPCEFPAKREQTPHDARRRKWTERFPARPVPVRLHRDRRRTVGRAALPQQSA
jgi:hypothetical protein